MFRAAGLTYDPWAAGDASDRPTGGAHGWLKSAVGRATGSELRTRKSLIRLDFIEQKSERSVMPQDTGVGRNVVLDGLDFASLRRVWKQTFGATPAKLALARFPGVVAPLWLRAKSAYGGCAFYIFIHAHRT